MSFPKKIEFIADDTIIEFQKEMTEPKRTKAGWIDVPNGEALYKYTKAKYFIGSTIVFTEKRINELKSKERIIILKP